MINTPAVVATNIARHSVSMKIRFHSFTISGSNKSMMVISIIETKSTKVKMSKPEAKPSPESKILVKIFLFKKMIVIINMSTITKAILQSHKVIFLGFTFSSFQTCNNLCITM